MTFTPEKIAFLAILVGALYCYFSQRIPIILTALLSIVALSLSGVLEIDEALAGFASTATVAIGAMFVLSAGLMRTGAFDPLARRIGLWSKGSWLRLILLMAGVVTITSAFMNNTPVVIMMIPVLLTITREHNMAPSKVMIPLSYFSVFGGICTLIGTSTNLLIDEIYHEYTQTHLGMFDFAPVGLIFLVIGTIYLLLFGRWLLPHRESLSAMLPQTQRSRYVTEMIVPQTSNLIGQTVGEAFSSSSPFRLLQLRRHDEIHFYADVHDKPIQANDALIVEGTTDSLSELLSTKVLEWGKVLMDRESVPIRNLQLLLVEIVVRPNSSFVGNRISNLALHSRFSVKVVAIQRGGRNHLWDLSEVRIKAGDVLLVQGESHGIEALRSNNEVLIIDEVSAARRLKKAKLSLAILSGVVLLALFTRVPLVIWALLGSALIILRGCLRLEEAIKALDFNVLFLLIGTIPLGTAMVKVGIVDDLTQLLIALAGPENPLLLLAALYLITNVLTHLVSNTAVAALMAPLAIGMAEQLGWQSKPFIMAVAFAASTALATPIGYQTNVLVMGPGGNRSGDFLRIGMPLSIILWLVACVAIPMVYGLGQ
ncbi:SLC13 family permease [Sulfidibacter corallicola]|uniref:SLC13 family permease n=1 Tax=Sulfidibacter corallicola TaxID=2818388 RepID=A0A8A4TF14_SULCO|nr:SLC13 family permease [Sulfidibacter corallicola]QTD48130.1 SLC13 family permease [Sulfidibacter corallicola]